MDEPNWPSWTPTERAALCYVIEGGRILLIRKKLGFGAGKISGPGGRIEPGESAADAARRETQEEIGVSPTGLAKAGELFFQFADGYALHCAVFTAQGAQGELVETKEAAPFWVETSAIPFAGMWADDALWMPWMLSKRPFRGYFCFDGERMLKSRLEPL